MAALQPLVGRHSPCLNRSFIEVLSHQSPTPLKIKSITSFRGEPAVNFSQDDINKLAASFNFALVGKFTHGRPSMEILRKAFASIDFLDSYFLGLLDHRHILIKFTKEEDFHRCWLRGLWMKISFQ